MPTRSTRASCRLSVAVLLLIEIRGMPDFHPSIEAASIGRAVSNDNTCAGKGVPACVFRPAATRTS